ncbi:phage recombination protein Bet [Thioalkalivibrio sp. ALE12]|uniref:phage recombination protein Bet n=1 Tax=Thioalkalivibrio sp. ALE12 TaxID=1158170 RepID=UPI000362470B|nr:phage recombination protein Bet [Thioalkalivibrio sp. ALE12]
MSNQMQQTNGARQPSVLRDMAERFGMDPAKFEQTLRATVFPADAGNEQFAAFLLTAKKYGLDPITKQIYAFPAKGGGIQPIVSIDGWMHMINSHPQFDGMEFEDQLSDQGKILAITCRMYRKDRNRPVAVTEYMEECSRPTDTWKKWPARMLRHKAAIQAARYAFGFSGVVDPDEADRVDEAVTGAATVRPQEPERPALPQLTDDEFQQQMQAWAGAIESGRMDAEKVVSMAETRWQLTDEQRQAIRQAGRTDEPEAIDGEWLQENEGETA